MKIITILVLSCTLIITNGYSQTQGDIPTQEEYEQALATALGSDATRFRQMLGALAAYCGTQENFQTGMGGNCDRLYFAALENDGGAVKRVLTRLRPREVVQSARTSVEIIANQQANLASRMSQVRAGINSIAITINGTDLPISALGYLAENSSNTPQLVSPWGFFINGQFSNGDYRYSDASDEGFDFDTNSFTAGIDYRFNNKGVAGLAIGRSSFDSVATINASTNSAATTYSAYGSYNINDNFYIDARLSHGSPDFEQFRVVQFILGGNLTDLRVKGSTQGTQDSYIISSGYQFNSMNGWLFTPSFSYEYNKTTVDAFVETGAPSFNVGFSEQNFKTNRTTIGIQASKAISLSNGVLIPSFNYNFVNENQNSDVVFMRISGMPAGEFFESPVNFNDDSYSTARIGLTFVAAHGKQAYIQYSKVIGWQGFNRNTIALGARFEF